VTVYLCSNQDLHPYECEGPGHCIHCDRTVTADHDPGECELCRYHVRLLDDESDAP